jgi:hypothetical protein
MGHDPCQRGGQAFIKPSWWAELVPASLRNGQIPGSAHRRRRQDDSRATSRWKIPTPACQSVPDQPRKQLQTVHVLLYVDPGDAGVEYCSGAVGNGEFVVPGGDATPLLVECE